MLSNVLQVPVLDGHYETPADSSKLENIIDLQNAQRERDVEELRGAILKELEAVEELALYDTKAAYRQMHEPHVVERLLKDKEWIQKKVAKYSSFFADGKDIEPEAIRPRLIEVTERWHKDLFRLGRYSWSLPYSSGYGRRLRFILIDESCEKLMGILGFQSPPIDFNVRDKEFNLPTDRKVQLVNQTMDIFTLGAIPPYNILLGGKLVALAAATNEIVAAYRRKYEGRLTEIEERVLPADLVAVTTTSAFGRSSIYNRLKYYDRVIAHSIGYTNGYGSFHFRQVYPKIKAFLIKYDEFKGGYGGGPRSVWRNCRRAMKLVGVEQRRLKHGIKRETFLFPLARNLHEYMSGLDEQPEFFDLPFTDAANWWRERWMLPRSERITRWREWEKQALFERLSMEEKGG